MNEHIMRINELEERIEKLETKHKGFASSIMFLILSLLPESPIVIQERQNHLERLKLLFRDRDFDFEEEKIIQNFLKTMGDII